MLSTAMLWRMNPRPPQVYSNFKLADNKGDAARTSECEAMNFSH